jgi:hypothetical protein
LEQYVAGHIADSSSIDWCSPLWITDGAHKVWEHRGGIHVDPCGNPGSLKRVRAPITFMLPVRDGLKDAWHGNVIDDGGDGTLAETVYVNSPFGAYYMHQVTKQILLPKELKAKCDELAVDPAKPTKEEKRVQRLLRAEYELQQISDWVGKCAVEATQHGMQVMQLGPANVETNGWQDFIETTANAILFPRGRIYFELVDFSTGEVLKTGPAPMACALSYWGDEPEKFRDVYKERGSVHILR